MKCGPYQWFAVTQHRHLYVWGLNDCQQLGIAKKEIVDHPYYIKDVSEVEMLASSQEITCVLSNEQQLTIWGDFKSITVNASFQIR